jgi:formylglycine-generating enzyme required for sulfatase activity
VGEATAATDAMVMIPGGEFAMGSEDHYREEGPVRRVAVDEFWIDPHQVTNADFGRFVEETGHVTIAELAPDPALYPGAPPENLVPGSMVFVMTDGPVDLRDYANWWAWTPGADWCHPTGPDSSIDDLEEHPVVHVAFADVAAFCAWAGKVLPTEAEWEYAARGGLDGAEFVWGDHDPQETEPVANTWQGGFPYENSEVDGWTRTAPVGSFRPNGYGLYDMAGNVWEWTDDWYRSSHGAEPEHACCVPSNPRGRRIEESFDQRQPEFPIPRKVLKGGSHLCTPQYCYRYRPAARQPQMVDTGMSHLGFRCVVRAG